MSHQWSAATAFPIEREPVRTADIGSHRSTRFLPVGAFALAIAVLFVLRAAALLIGLDRLPMVPSVQAEVIINDPALALSRGYGLVAPSFEHSLHGLDLMFAHFPPVFIVLQSLVFSIFGFSAWTMRASSVVADLGACLLFVAILWELHRRRVVDRLGLLLGSFLVMLEPTVLIHSRDARMESLNVLLGAFAFYLCQRAVLSHRFELPLWFAAACTLGIALGFHLASLLLLPVLFVSSLFRFRRLGTLRWIAVNAVPAVVFVCIWIAAYGGRSLEALIQMRAISSYAPRPSLRLVDFMQALGHGALKGVNDAGGFALVLTLIALSVAAWRILSSRENPQGAPALWRTSLLCFSAIVLLQCLLLQFVVPTSGENRVVMTVHFASICAAVAFSYTRPSRRSFLKAGIAIAVVLEVAMTAGYLGQLRSDWNGRSAERFDAFVQMIPADARVVAPPELWYAFRHEGRQFAMIMTTLDEDRYWKESPAAFDPYDVVILDPNSSDYPLFIAKAERGRPIRYSLHSRGVNYEVFARPAMLSQSQSSTQPQEVR